jgi:hypothetical protein
LAIVAAALPGAALAYGSPRPALSADQARGIFIQAGYQIDQFKTWEWLTPPVTTFQVHDVARNQVLLVQAYPDVAQAEHGSEHMVEGYSASTWIDNLALFQANADDYQRVMAYALERSLGMQPYVEGAGAPTTRFDAEYTALVSGALDRRSIAIAAAEEMAVSVVLTGAQVRDTFTRCGFQVGDPGVPGNDRYLPIQDPGASEMASMQDTDYRVAMAIVYPPEQTINDGNGARLLPGYGASVWRGNVALVESTHRTLTNLYPYNVQWHEVVVNDPAHFQAGLISIESSLGVDRDLVACLDSADSGQ